MGRGGRRIHPSAKSVGPQAAIRPPSGDGKCCGRRGGKSGTVCPVWVRAQAPQESFAAGILTREDRKDAEITKRLPWRSLRLCGLLSSIYQTPVAPAPRDERPQSFAQCRSLPDCRPAPSFSRKPMEYVESRAEARSMKKILTPRITFQMCASPDYIRVRLRASAVPMPRRPANCSLPREVWRGWDDRDASPQRRAW
jgi:hypothetical protein